MKTIRFSPSLAKGWLLAIMLMMGVEVAMADAGIKKLCAYVASDKKSMTLVFCNPDDAPPSGYSRYVYDGGNNWNSSFHETVQNCTIDASCQNFDGTELKALFWGCTALKGINSLENLCTANVEKMDNVFYNCSSLTSLSLPYSEQHHAWDMSKVTSVIGMFEGCSKLGAIDLSGWNTSNVTKMTQMFKGCAGLKKIDISSFNTSKVESMVSMFENCTQLQTIWVGSKWSTAAVTGGSLMFQGCSAIVGADGTTYNSANTSATYAKVGDGGYLSNGLKTQAVEGRRWMTFYDDENSYQLYDFNDLKVYSAKYDADHSRLILKDEGKVIPKETPVIIMGSDVANNEYAKMFVTTATSTIADNDLNGSNLDYPVQNLKNILSERAHVEYGTGEIYVMGVTSKGFGFHRYTAETFPAHRAFLYLPLPPPASNAITITFISAVTGIEEVQGDKGQGDKGQSTKYKGQGDDIWHTLGGMRLQGKPSAPGMYINNGKKTIVK